jgi:D-alanine-D-alanine ligase
VEVLPANSDRSQSPLRIVVLLGGPSAEREVSLRSGTAVAAALAARGHCVTRLDPAAAVAQATNATSDVRLDQSVWAIRDFDWQGVDVAYNALHGTFGEDGQIQLILESLGIAYTGAGVAASRVGFSKRETKERLLATGLPTPEGYSCDAATTEAEAVELATSLGFPVVLKPDRQGSSIGVSIVPDAARLPAAIELCQRYGPAWLIERFVAGTEWTVPVWDDEALPAIQIVPAAGFYDYEAKYHSNDTQYRIDPAETARSWKLELQALAVRAAAAIGCAGLSRVDFRVSTSGEPFILEINTSPGMTDHSLVPKAAAYAGWSLGALCEEDCRRALQNQRTRLHQT